MLLSFTVPKWVHDELWRTVDQAPLLFHTGLRSLFEAVSHAIVFSAVITAVVVLFTEIIPKTLGVTIADVLSRSAD